MQIRFHGATGGTTGTCHQLRVGERSVLLDCGLFQGRREDAYRRNQRFRLELDELDAVVQSHAHIDHSGKLPMLVREGWSGPIHATHGTRDLCAVMLRDCAHILLKDAEFLNRKRVRDEVRKRRKRDRGRRWDADAEPESLGRADRPLHEVLPLYLDEDVQETLPLFVPHKYGAWFDAAPGMRFRFHDAGHILGSAWVEGELTEQGRTVRLVFTADYGRPQPILRDPEPLLAADVFVSESTYGNRLHGKAEDNERALAEAVERLDQRGTGRLLIPAFAVGRTQHILYLLARIFGRRPQGRLEVVVDSPLATAATRIVTSHPEYFDEEAREVFRRWEQDQALRLRFTESVEQSKALNGDPRPTILIAASGMMESGRVLHHLAWNVSRTDCEILVVGYQAEGTLGRRIVEGAREVPILGERYAVHARVTNLLGFSAHADRAGLLAALLPHAASARKLFLVHGEADQRAPLAQALREGGFRDVIEPDDDRPFEL